MNDNRKYASCYVLLSTFRVLLGTFQVLLSIIRVLLSIICVLLSIVRVIKSSSPGKYILNNLSAGYRLKRSFSLVIYCCLYCIFQRRSSDHLIKS